MVTFLGGKLSFQIMPPLFILNGMHVLSELYIIDSPKHKYTVKI